MNAKHSILALVYTNKEICKLIRFPVEWKDPQASGQPGAARQPHEAVAPPRPAPQHPPHHLAASPASHHQQLPRQQRLQQRRQAGVDLLQLAVQGLLTQP